MPAPAELPALDLLARPDLVGSGIRDPRGGRFVRLVSATLAPEADAVRVLVADPRSGREFVRVVALGSTVLRAGHLVVDVGPIVPAEDPARVALDDPAAIVVGPFATVEEAEDAADLLALDYPSFVSVAGWGETAPLVERAETPGEVARSAAEPEGRTVAETV